MNERTEKKLSDLSGMNRAIGELLQQAWERGRKYGNEEKKDIIRAFREEVLREFAKWVKTEAVYVGGEITDREILVIRNEKYVSAIDEYLKAKEQEEFYSNGYKRGYEDAKKQYNQ